MVGNFFCLGSACKSYGQPWKTIYTQQNPLGLDTEEFGRRLLKPMLYAINLR